MTSPPDSPSMLPLVALVRAKLEASGQSLREFAEERRVPYSTIRRYADRRLTALKQPPRAETLRELAQALDEPLSVVQRAADRSVDRRYRDEDEPSAATHLVLTHPSQDHAAPLDIFAAIEADPHLIPEAKEHLRNQVRLLLRVAAEAPAAQGPHPADVAAAKSKLTEVPKATRRSARTRRP